MSFAIHIFGPTSGREEGINDRPALVLALAVVADDAQLRVLVLAITHVKPRLVSEAVELPSATKLALGLDDVPSWIVTTEANSFIWPGRDIRPVPGRKPSSPFYGRIPATSLARVARSYLDNRERQRARIVPGSF
ncbi:plasmid maintenance toxin (PemK-like) [Taklimakanibacter albus]|uniref:Plasmid maintenance toxin (PemK-like) n=1 Tax=Taklimakanibacter albus TaxID=2800327 RepID=A0ACC5REC8_9HYPH|nr:plasmid maintenance toxin (PemK-like) [Aestuariivirga sp. YIM B02566]MBK1870949.1 plasmid maintenance toxin (PemK-like) [Aestuariivirga sp. YIM B02566]